MLQMVLFEREKFELSFFSRIIIHLSIQVSHNSSMDRGFVFNLLKLIQASSSTDEPIGSAVDKHGCDL